MVNTPYSQALDDKLWNAVGADYEQDYEYEELLAHLNSREFFRSFSDRLLTFYNGVLESDFDADSAAKDLLRRGKERGISFNRNTVRSWFSGDREPKKGDSDRNRLFGIAFALELTPEDTERLFHKVFLDKAFNRRNPVEFIYLYCLSARKPFGTAEEMISKLISSESAESADMTMLTQYMDAYAQVDRSEAEVLDFILHHPHNFALNNTTAKKYLKTLLDDILGSSDKVGLAEQDFDLRRAEYLSSATASGSEGRNTKSVDFMLYVIKGQDVVKRDDASADVRDLFPREISNQFPDKQSFALNNPSSYILRKEIILLYFYWYWVQVRIQSDREGDYDEFVDELNDVLFECGYSPLYIGNPYDWLFMYCAAAGSMNTGTCPTDIFRGILDTEYIVAS